MRKSSVSDEISKTRRFEHTAFWLILSSLNSLSSSALPTIFLFVGQLLCMAGAIVVLSYGGVSINSPLVENNLDRRKMFQNILLAFPCRMLWIRRPVNEPLAKRNTLNDNSLFPRSLNWTINRSAVKEISWQLTGRRIGKWRDERLEKRHVEHVVDAATQWEL